MFTAGLLLIVTAAADATCEVDQDGTCVSDFDDDFVSLAQLRATLARASGTSSEGLEMDMDLAALDTLEGSDAAAVAALGWKTVAARKGKDQMTKMSYVWQRKSKKGWEGWINSQSKGRTNEAGPKGWTQVKKNSAKKHLNKLTNCWFNGRTQYYCIQKYR
jgi:hypothetical protein